MPPTKINKIKKKMEPQTTTTTRNFSDLKYLHGIANHHTTSSLPNALPPTNNPQKCPYGLYAEQISGTSFTQQRHLNKFSYLYRIKPSVTHKPFTPCLAHEFPNLNNDFDKEEFFETNPNQLRWKPLAGPEVGKKVDFARSIFTMCGNGGPGMKSGLCIYKYSCNVSMGKEVLCNADGDFLVVPQIGTLEVITEMGKLTVAAGEVAGIPRGIRFSVDVAGDSRGWVCEIFNGHFGTPDLGPIGGSGLANNHHFEIPEAAFENVKSEFTIFQKFGGKMFKCTQDNSPFNVVAWHGTYYPFKYDCAKFVTVNSVCHDHLDPSIFTVLTCPTSEPGTALCDFVIFPPRWLVAEGTFRPPYYHRNTMSEFMGNISGTYDAKEAGFGPGCSSLHSTMTPHGPEAEVFEKSSNAELKPVKLDNTLAFMFETCLLFRIYKKALGECMDMDEDYWKCWQGLKSHFDDHDSQA